MSPARFHERATPFGVTSADLRHTTTRDRLGSAWVIVAHIGGVDYDVALNAANDPFTGCRWLAELRALECAA